ncbi:winged helix-turn-helix transcriptional regulator [Agromyces intestinalis]|uniref:winged helix-turn-helix transcriptional regulator n=1 Tax=Agromyces intestinalis TaxID=2592652 RepID=UPI00143CD12E|nr:winged helix-turn-helix transcriptional regulator [Agromyces intestinalis]
MVDRRSYRQACGLALALDVVGERWTLLIVRELLIAPRRFSELHQALDGIGATVLSERMQHLVRHGIAVQHVMEGDRRGRVYELTAAGEELRPAVLALAQWGLRSLSGSPEGYGEPDPTWAFLALQAMAQPALLGEGHAAWTFSIGDQAFSLRIDHGRMSAERGPTSDPDLSIEGNAHTFLAIGSGHLDVGEALRTGRISVQGSRDALRTCLVVMGFEEGLGAEEADASDALERGPNPSA